MLFRSSVSKSAVNGDFLSVVEQSGIKAGDGGFQLAVGGSTDLVGGVISSSQTAVDEGRNILVTGRLSYSDLINRDTYSASSYSLSGSFSAKMGDQSSAVKPMDTAAADAKTGVGTSAGFGSASGNQESLTKAGISGGVITLANGSEVALAGLDRTTTTGDASTALTKKWNADQLLREVQAGAEITSAALPVLTKQFADIAVDRAKELRAEGNEEEAKKWDEGGAYRIAGHAAIGALGGGASGALGAATAAAAAPSLNDLQREIQGNLTAAGMKADNAENLAKLFSGVTAAGTGALAGSAAGAVTAINEDFNNRQLHPEEIKVIEKLVKEQVQRDCKPSDAQCVKQLTTLWTDALERVAEGVVDDEAHARNIAYLQELQQASSNSNSVGNLGGLDGYTDMLYKAAELLVPYQGETILTKGRPTVEYDGVAQQYFSATARQRADSDMNSPSAHLPGPIISGMELRDQNRVEAFSAINGGAEKVYPLEEALLEGKVLAAGARLLGNAWAFVGKVSNEAHNAANFSRYLDELRTIESANPLVESLRTTGQLPSNYLNHEQAAKAGWKAGKALENSVPGGQIGGSIFRDDFGILPPASGRVWYEADIGLTSKMSRSNQPGTRLLYSNDGLLYVTPDHYKSVVPIGTWK